MNVTRKAESSMANRLGLAMLLTLSLPSVLGAAPRVRRVEIRSEQAIDVARVESLIEIETGRPLDPEAVRRTLHNLHLAQLGEPIEVRRVATPSGDEVTVEILLFAPYRIESLRLEGELGLPHSELRRWVAAREGDPLLEDRLLEGVYRLTELLTEAGYLGASVKLAVEADDVRKTVAITYDIASGERAVVSALVLSGDIAPSLAEQLVQSLAFDAGVELSRRRIEEWQRGLVRQLRRRGFPRARVHEPTTHFDAERGSAVIVWPVSPGPHLVVTVNGPDSKATLERRGLLPFLGEAGYDEALVAQSVIQIERFYQEKGFYDVRVDPQIEIEGDEIEVTLEVDPKERYRLSEVLLEGNATFDDDDLLRLLLTGRRGGFRSARLVWAWLEEDRQNLESFYVLEGFGEVEIEPPVVDRLREPSGEGEGLLRVRIPIREGPRQRISAIELEPNPILALADLGPLPVKAGDGYHPQHVEDLRRAIVAAARQRGYQEVLVAANIEWDPAQANATVRLLLEPGLRTLLGRVFVRGHPRTRAALIERALNLHRGEPFDRLRLLEAQRRLHRLGIFSSVQVEAATRSRRQAAGSVFFERNVLVDVEEGDRWRLGYGVGYDSRDKIGGLLSVSYNNVGGRAARLRLDLRRSEREARYRLQLTDRPLLGFGTRLEYALYHLDEEISDVESSRSGVQIEASRLLDTLQASLFYDYRLVESTPLAAAARPPILDRELEDARISSLTPLLHLDRRDDPIDPQSGYSLTAQLTYAFPLLGADEHFLKFFTQGTGYADLGRFGVLAASLRFGALEPVVNRSVGFLGVPISERFFAGGRTTHRAYEKDRLGVVGETVVDGLEIGGGALALLNVDLRFPIAGAVGGVLFFDSGNVWGKPSSVRLGEVKSGLGLGLRYLSPIGPLRLEAGWKLDRDPGEAKSAIFLSLGNAF